MEVGFRDQVEEDMLERELMEVGRRKARVLEMKNKWMSFQLYLDRPLRRAERHPAASRRPSPPS